MTIATYVPFIHVWGRTNYGNTHGWSSQSGNYAHETFVRIVKITA